MWLLIGYALAESEDIDNVNNTSLSADVEVTDVEPEEHNVDNNTLPTVPQVCMDHSIIWGVKPDYVPRNQCPKKDFICPSPSYTPTEDSFSYSQVCKMADIGEYVARLEHYRLIEHNGAVIVGDHLDQCVKGGIAAVEKSYRKNSRYASLFTTRTSQGETAPRVQFLSYEDDVYYGDGVDSTGSKLPICTPIVWESKTSGKRPDTRLLHLHCGQPSPLQNKCYVLPGSNSPRHTKIKMTSLTSSQLDQALLELKNPTYAIQDMQYKIENGCHNTGVVPMEALSLTWSQPKQDIENIWGQCVGDTGFLFATADSPQTVELPNLDYSAFNFEDADGLWERLDTTHDQIYFSTDMLQEQVAVSQERKRRYDTCIESYSKKVNVLQTREEVVLLDRAVTTLTKQLDRWMHNTEEVGRIQRAIQPDISAKLQQLNLFSAQMASDHSAMVWYVTGFKEKYPHLVDSRVNRKTVQQQYDRMEGDIQVQIESVHSLQQKLQTLQEEFDKIRQNVEDMQQIIDPQRQTLEQMDIQTAFDVSVTFPYSTEGIQQCSEAIDWLDKIAQNLDETRDAIDHLLNDVKRQALLIEESTQLLGDLLKATDTHVLDLDNTRPVFDIMAFVSLHDGKVNKLDKRMVQLYQYSYWRTVWYYQWEHPRSIRVGKRVLWRKRQSEKIATQVQKWMEAFQKKEPKSTP